MIKSMLELVVGSLDEKRAYRQLMKRADALPKEYRFAFKKIQNYIYNVGAYDCDMDIFTDLLDLLEESAAGGKAVPDVMGSDVATFCDELIRASTQHTTTTREALNQEIWQHFYGEESKHDEHH